MTLGSILARLEKTHSLSRPWQAFLDDLVPLLAHSRLPRPHRILSAALRRQW